MCLSGFKKVWFTCSPLSFWIDIPLRSFELCWPFCPQLTCSNLSANICTWVSASSRSRSAKEAYQCYNTNESLVIPFQMMPQLGVHRCWILSAVARPTFRWLSSASDFHASHTFDAWSIRSSQFNCLADWLTKSSLKHRMSFKPELFNNDGDIEYCLFGKLYSNKLLPTELDRSSLIGIRSGRLNIHVFK